LTAFSALKPAAPRENWPRIAFMFSQGFDTALIAKFIGFSEAEVANALHLMREEART
jgi:hypothetical protein